MSPTKLKLISFILLILIVIMSYLTFYQPSYTTSQGVYAEIPPEVLTTPLPTPTTAQVMQSSDMLSPDGKKYLVLTQTTQGDTVSFECSVIDTASGDSILVFQTGTTSSEIYRIPFNAWSPDNSYFFLKRESAGTTDSMVFRATGETFRGELTLLNVSDIFYDKIEDFTITDVTGWASPTLIIINTVSTDHSTNVSFWLDVTSQSIIRLGTYFE